MTLLACLTFCAAILAACTLPSAITSPCGLSTLTVTKTEDTNDGVCNDADCSLREAVIASNTCSGTHTIKLPPGTYKLTRTGANEEAANTGDLDINSSIVIQGSGAKSTILDGNLSDRIFDVKANQTLFISALTLQNGQTPMFGSAIANQGNLAMDHVIIQKNIQTDPKGSGGAIFSYDQGNSVEIHNSAVVNNTAIVGAGGLYNLSGNMTIENVTFTGNTGYAIANMGGQTVITFSTLAADIAEYEIWNPLNGQAVTISNSILDSLSKNGACLQPLSSGGFNLDNSSSSTLHTCGLTGMEDLVNTDPRLLPLGDNGGNTLTMGLEPASPAIDSANLQTCSTTDQRDVSRPQGSQCDRGAFELENPPARPTATLVPRPTRAPLPTSTPRPSGGQPHDPNETTLTFQASTNCREGPNAGFKLINAFSIGQTVSVLGRTQDKTWLNVKVPSSTLTCWVTAAAGSLNGQGPIYTVIQIPTLPQTPDSFADSTTCKNGQRSVVLSWTVDALATGYNIYRKDKLITTLPTHESSYTDDPPYQNDFEYQIESFNQYGISARAVTLAKGCP